MVIKNPLFSVFTPTYQRAHTLDRLYQSLLRQQDKDFEWIVVDDGSTDSTKELIQGYALEEKIKIKYIFKENGGKHTAHNEALKHAKGELFLVIDSDDELTDECLVKFRSIWENIPQSKKDDYAGIIGEVVNKLDQKSASGKNIEGEFFDLCLKKIIVGEKIHLIKTSLMKKNPFPEDLESINEYMVEGLVWLKVMKSKKIIFTSEPFRIYNKDEEDDLSLMNQGNNILQGCLGKAYYCNEELANFKNSYFLFIFYFLKSASKFNRYSHHANIPFKTRLNMQTSILTSLLVFITYPIGYLVALIDKKGVHF